MKLSTGAFAVALIATAGSGMGAFAFEKRIVGGSSLDSAANYSFLTNIISTTDRKSASVCTGALISPTIVITAASCVADNVGNKALSSSQVIVGQGNPSEMLAKVSGKNSVNLSAAAGYVSPQSVNVHPGYNSIAYSDNIAVLILAQPLSSSSSSGAKLITKPSTTVGASYTAVGYGITSATNATSYSSSPKQLTLSVASNSTCTSIWKPYSSLTNSLCLEPADSSSANVCNGDGFLVKVAADNSVGLAGLLNIVAAENDVPAYKCTDDGAVDFFTTFSNYVAWFTQITPLKESDFTSTNTYDYTKSPGDESSSSADDASSSESGSLSDEDEESLTKVDSEHSSASSVAAGIVALLSGALLSLI
ncbi:hypothetical protein GGI25_004982 [Coemansia spiralis]|uniref:Peptidase S1 domain-containing protein n=2 Tax=Coemansia TaxID=4863 RepID=A0A9W8G4P0_9FUNG|nr:hypothetical protein EDC05_004858 [Coemansia umbellata]KAJ2620118.1 hypothetical protein GGI26_005290 [Coemansia sp. RSA 1358]KAJ2672787.1 hypothetical protein GGI25_004982 [Coemansia spiralis]